MTRGSRGAPIRRDRSDSAVLDAVGAGVGGRRVSVPQGRRGLIAAVPPGGGAESNGDDAPRRLVVGVVHRPAGAVDRPAAEPEAETARVFGRRLDPGFERLALVFRDPGTAAGDQDVNPLAGPSDADGERRLVGVAVLDGVREQFLQGGGDAVPDECRGRRGKSVSSATPGWSASTTR